MPKIDYAEYIVELAFEIGICQSTELGLVETSWAEIHAWSQVMRLKLSNLECIAIKTLSRSYIDQTYKSKSDTEPPPFTSQSFDREAASKRIGNVLRGLAARSNSKRKGPANTGRR